MQSEPVRLLLAQAADLATAATIISIVALILSALSVAAAVWSAMTARRTERRSHYDVILDASVFAASAGDWPEYPRSIDFHVVVRNRGRAPVQVDRMFVDVLKWRRRAYREYLEPERTWGDDEDLKLPHILPGLSRKAWIVEDIALPDNLVRKRRLVVRVRLGPGEVLSSRVMRPTWLKDPDLQMHREPGPT